MFRITEDPSSGSLVQCLAKNYKNDSLVSVDMDKVGVMAAYCVYAQWVTICCHNTFKYFIILIVSTYYILCISWIIRCLFIIDARCKHEDQMYRIKLCNLACPCYYTYLVPCLYNLQMSAMDKKTLTF